MNDAMPSMTHPTADIRTLATALRVATARLRRRMREHVTPGTLSWPQLSVLSRLEREGPTTITLLAKGECMRPQSLGPHILALQKAGLVKGKPDPQDGRQTILSVTPLCHTWLREHRAAGEDWLAGLMAQKLSQTDIDTIARALPLLERLAQE